MKPNETCRFLSNGYRFEIRPQGNVVLAPCCYWNGNTPNILESNETLVNFRNNIKNKDSYHLKQCSHCNYMSDRSLPGSLRSRSFTIVPDDSEFEDPSFVEIQVSKTCNASCIMCNSQFSTLWQSELKKFNIPDDTKNVDFDYISRILEIVDLQKTRRFNFHGGEGMLIGDDLKILPLVNDLSQVSVCYATNGSYVNSSVERKELWKKLKELVISFSIDGVGDRFEYIRYPLKWNIVESNLNKMCEDIELDNIFSPRINHTINILNLYYYDEIENWYKIDAPEKIRNRPINYIPAYGLLSPLSVTPKLYELLIDKYGYDHFVTNTVVDTNLDPKLIINYLDGIDYRRGLNWKQVFLEIKDCFD